MGDNIEKLKTDKFEFVEKEWQKRKHPDNEEYEKVNLVDMYPDNHWNVFIENNHVMVSKIFNYYNKFKFDVDNGYFISDYFNSKKLKSISGKLNFIGNDDMSYSVLEYINPISMFSIDGEVYLIEGTHNRASGIGNLYKIEEEGYYDEFDKHIMEWRADKLIKLNGYPIAFFIDNSDIYIIILLPSWGQGISEIIKISIKDSMRSNYLETETLIKIPYDLLGVTSMVK